MEIDKGIIKCEYCNLLISTKDKIRWNKHNIETHIKACQRKCFTNNGSILDKYFTFKSK